MRRPAFGIEQLPTDEQVGDAPPLDWDALTAPWHRAARRLDNCMAGVGAVLGTTVFCLFVAPAIVGALIGTPS